MFKRISKTVIAIALVAASLAAGAAGAQAKPFKGGFHHGHGGWRGPAAIGLGLGVIGAIAASSAYAATADDDVEYAPVCRMERQFDDDGVHLGRARICRTVAD